MDLLKMSGIDKAFLGVPVLNQVFLEVGTGEVHALLGENGAGKSTLMNILGGVYTKDKGMVVFSGKELCESSVQETEEAGISFVHQELNIFNNLKVYENLYLGKEIVTRYGKLKKQEMIADTRQLMLDLGADINPTDLAGDLDTGKKQLLEIAKAIHTDAKLIILDEPTTALNNEGVAKLFEIINRLKKAGKSFIFISHKMPEIFEIADTYSVLRNGCLISSGLIKDVSPEILTKDMVGSNTAFQELYEKRDLGAVVLELKALSGEGFSEVSLTARKGEIIGITGLQGAGCSELLQAIFGATSINSGEMYIQGKRAYGKSIHESMKNKIAMVAANRKENSIIPDMNILENTYISEHCVNAKQQNIIKKNEIKKYERYKERLNIKAADYNAKITSLSGGNQQKVILARWLNTEAEIFLFDNPTQGIDVGAKSEIYKLILDLSKGGKTIIVSTLEIPEIKKIADRCLVFYHGKTVMELERAEISEETVMYGATNADKAKGMREETDNV